MHTNRSRQLPAKAALALLIAPLALLTVAGCPVQTPNPDPKASSGPLKRFASPDDLLSYFRSQARQQNASGYRGGWLFDAVPALAPQEDAATGGDNAGGGGAGVEFTGTNLQEAGVDEADVVKTEGRYLYVAAGRTLRIVDISGDAPVQVGRLDFAEQLDELYLRDGSLIALTTPYGKLYDGGIEPAFDIAIWPPYFPSNEAVLYQVDITDVTAPTVIGTMRFDGTLVSSRIVDDRLVLVLTFTPELPASGGNGAIDNISLPEVLPAARSGVDEVASASVTWDNWYRPESPNGYVSTIVVTLAADDIETALGSVGVMAAAGTIYASTEALYITDTQWTPSGDSREVTTVHKFDLTTPAATYAGTGTVPGRLLNQFSLSEHAGNLRVATHVEPAYADVLLIDPGIAVALGFGGTSGGSGGAGVDAVVVNDAAQDTPTGSDAPNVAVNCVYVLGAAGDELTIIGAAEGLAPTEQIYSARFLGETGYLVTFQQVDPLFVLDLSDPASPRVTGELKIPGYSDYLHPVDETHLIGVGQSVTTASWGGLTRAGIQISLFNVADMTNPTLVDQQTIGGGGSQADASYTHKAFTYLASQNLMALPSVVYPGGNGAFFGNPNGEVLCYQVNLDSGFTALGTLDMPAEDEFDWYGGGWRRAVIVGETIYALNGKGVVAAPLSDMSTTQTVLFAE